MSTDFNFSSRRGFGVYDALTRIFDASHDTNMQKRQIKASAVEREKNRAANERMAQMAADERVKIAREQAAVRQAEIDSNCRIAAINAETQRHQHDTVLQAELDRNSKSVTIAELNYKSKREAGMGVLELQYATEDRRRREAEEEERQGGVVRDFNGERIPGVYVGDYLRKIPHGKGDFYYDDNRHYVGDFAAGRFGGYGEWYDENGLLVYRGQWASGRFNGEGRLRISDGNYFVGTFRGGKFLKGVFTSDFDAMITDRQDDNLFHISDSFNSQRGEYDYEGEHSGMVPNGRGIKTYPNGDYDNGTFVDGRAEGLLVRHRNGRLYMGNVRNDLPEGNGKIRLADGSTIDGIFTDGKLQGFATAYSPDGTSFEGEWHQDGDTLIMQGRAAFHDGRVIEGSFHDLKAYGICRSHDAEGYDYSGTFLDNRPLTGSASQTFPDGTRVDLTIKDGTVRRNITTYPDGATFTGKWQNGEWKSGTLRLPDGYVYTGSFRSFRLYGHVFASSPSGEQYEFDV